MRIAVASDDKKNTAYHLDGTEGFMIFDVVKGKIIDYFYRPLYNPIYWQFSNGNDKSIGLCEAILKALTDCDTIISFGIETNILNKLARAGIEVFQTNETDVRNAVELYIEAKLNNIQYSYRNYNYLKV